MKSETRREWMKRLAMGGGVLLLGVAGYRREEAEALLRRGKNKVESWMREGEASLSQRGEFPVDEEVPEEAEYRVFLEGLGLRYFTAEEILRPHRNYRNGVRNHVPPMSLWEQIVPTLKLADRMRSELGVKVEILSVYRSLSYNTAVGGASRSQHMRNKAVDLKFHCSSTRAFELAKRLREEGVFSGGVGWYPNFIHVDTRGYDATWGKG